MGEGRTVRVATEPELVVERRLGRVGPAAGVVLACSVAGVVLALLALAVPGPDVFGDELFYMEAGTALSRGEGLEVRGVPYRFAPAYPLVVAAAAVVAPDGSTAYALALVLNALIVATAGIPIFLLARRVVRPWVAAGIASASLLLPVSVYAGYVMTDCLGYVAALWALLAIQKAVEHASPTNQVAALAACVLATAVRYQYAVLVPTYILALGLRPVLDGRRPPVRAALLRLTPTLVVSAAAVVFVAARELLAGGSVLGGYATLWRSYDVGAVAEWTAYHVLGLGLYLLVAPVVLLPGIVRALGQAARNGDSAAAALAATLLSATTCGLVLVGTFSSTTFGGGRLHDRYLAYLVPLWLVSTAAWAVRGAPVLRRGSALVVLLLASIAAAAPLDRLIVFRGVELFDAVGTAPWALARRIAGADGPALKLLTISGIVLVGVLALRRGRSRALLAAGLAVAVSVSAWGMWARTISVGGKGAYLGTSAAERLWVDRPAAGRRVTALFHVGERCDADAMRGAYWVTEMFNREIVSVVSLDTALGAHLPETSIHLAADGVALDGENVVHADLVLAPPSLELLGERVATGTTQDLVLWRTDGPIRIVARRPCAVA